MANDLFAPATVKSLQLPNRFVRSATWEGMCTPEGGITDKLLACYRQLAAGKVGLIISGYAHVRRDGQQLPGKMGIYDDSLVEGLRALTDVVHEFDSKIFCQLVHAGGQASAKMCGTGAVAPSAIESPLYPEVPRELGTEEIEPLVRAFADGARRAREAGFDGVQLHGAHGYLINQFLSPLTNRRTDRYGGSLENRQRFCLEVLAAVRAEVGDDYPVTIKLTAGDNLAGGFPLEDALDVARNLEAAGIDAIEVSAGTPASGKLGPVRTGIDTESDEAYNAGAARAMKETVDVPVMTVGGLRSLTVLDSLAQSGDVDFFSFSRPLIREPGLVARWERGDTHRATCISCNGCFKPGLKEGGIYCVVAARPE
ncbi:MAG: NADH:flavin oxidoreductase [Desulfuromonadales bacterium]|nr:NADH:flavin oxidoreductase [Desulfuromonadales bacterium]NIR33622.1 NADH:flavin oxidoreductase [Desulfuromonadales bacterium]NIS41242.1 NADH:flavin oxidoreductase [Desulfuromonadales bacterium]